MNTLFQVQLFTNWLRFCQNQTHIYVSIYVYIYIFTVRLTPFQRELYSYYLDNISTKGEKDINARGRAVSGLFTDYQNLMRVWTHPKLLATHSLKREFAELLIEKVNIKT